jgi:broad specificity phosphatase PhoE
MATIIYLVRHGEVYNPDQIIYGRLDGFKLSHKGREQAHKLGDYLSKKKLAAIYASPLLRTHETATFIHKHHGHLEIMHDERIIECYTPLEGEPIEKVEKNNWNFYAPEFLEKGGESLSDIWNRMNTFFEEKVHDHEGEEIAVVTHGDPIMITAAKHTGKPLVVDSIRGDYVETAKGFKIIFEKSEAIEVSKLDF